jgi:hypothetical protein
MTGTAAEGHQRRVFAQMDLKSGRAVLCPEYLWSVHQPGLFLSVNDSLRFVQSAAHQIAKELENHR